MQAVSPLALQTYLSAPEHLRLAISGVVLPPASTVLSSTPPIQVLAIVWSTIQPQVTDEKNPDVFGWAVTLGEGNTLDLTDSHKSSSVPHKPMRIDRDCGTA